MGNLFKELMSRATGKAKDIKLPTERGVDPRLKNTSVSDAMQRATEGYRTLVNKQLIKPSGK